MSTHWHNTSGWGGTSFFGLYGYLPLDRVWFLGPYKSCIHFNRLAPWTGYLFGADKGKDWSWAVCLCGTNNFSKKLHDVSLKITYQNQGFWYFAEKKAKFRGIFRGKFAEKSANFAGFSREKKSKFAEKSADFAGFSRKKSQNSQKNRPISRDFSGKKSNLEGFSGANC